MMVDSLLVTGKAEGRNPLRALKEIGKLIVPIWHPTFKKCDSFFDNLLP